MSRGCELYGESFFMKQHEKVREPLTGASILWSCGAPCSSLWTTQASSTVEVENPHIGLHHSVTVLSLSTPVPQVYPGCHLTKGHYYRGGHQWQYEGSEDDHRQAHHQHHPGHTGGERLCQRHRCESTLLLPLSTNGTRNLRVL